MKGDLNPAALRLLQSLPVRTHTSGDASTPARNAWSRLGDGIRAASARKRILTGRGRGGLNARGIRCKGRNYPSLKAATRALDVSNTTIYNMLADGRAEYIK